MSAVERILILQPAGTACGLHWHIPPDMSGQGSPLSRHSPAEPPPAAAEQSQLSHFSVVGADAGGKVGGGVGVIGGGVGVIGGGGGVGVSFIAQYSFPSSCTPI